MKTDKFDRSDRVSGASDYDGAGTACRDDSRSRSCRQPTGQEVFTAGAPIFPSTGVELLRGHRGEAIYAFSARHLTGVTIRIDAPLPDSATWSTCRDAKSAAARGPRSLSNSYH